MPASLTSSAWARVRIRRVSSAAITSALPRALTSRADASDGWPSGVAPISSRPVRHAGQPTIAVVTAPADERRQRRAVPVISPAPLVPVADFGPVDRLQGWAMTAVVTALAAVTRFLNLGSPTDAGTPIFDEKHYAPQAWQMLHNHGVEDNPGYGLVVHPPVGKQLIAIGEAMFGYNGLGWRFSGAVCGVITRAAGRADRAADQPVHAGRRDRRAAADRRRGQLRRVAHRAARRLPDACSWWRRSAA